MEYINYKEFIKTDIGKSYLEDNPSNGRLKIEAFMGYRSIPLEGVNITILKDIEDYRVIFYNGFTDSSGIINDIILPAPNYSNGDNYNERPKYTLYNLISTYKNNTKDYEIGMFGDVSIIQYIKFDNMEKYND